jgi:DNA-binding GntR family transcriptional regulator
VTDERQLTRGAVVDSIADRIRMQIVQGQISIGTWLRQETLAAEFNVSRQPIREALRKLQAEGIVAIAPNRGALVQGWSPAQIRDAYAVRAELEGMAARLAAAHIEPAQLVALGDAERLFAEAVLDPCPPSGIGSAPWEQANTMFHEAVMDAADNPRLRRTVEELHRGFPRNLTWAALSERPDLIAASAQEHTRIRQAIADGRAGDARRHMMRHLTSAGELIACFFERLATVS